MSLQGHAYIRKKKKYVRSMGIETPIVQVANMLAGLVRLRFSFSILGHGQLILKQSLRSLDCFQQ